MRIAADITDLSMMHPRLLWSHLSAALVAVVGPETSGGAPTIFELTTSSIPDHGSEKLEILLKTGGIIGLDLDSLRRTYEAPRLVELAAIAIAGLGLYHAGRHEIRDVALRGTAADYLVDEPSHLLEVAGRSRRNDLEATWQRKWQRLCDVAGSGFYLCVVEFETRTGKLAFQV
ncbi:MAG: hypothetical protein ACREHD_29625 [Pirellulales bacterium]